jgi:type IV pilus assembly protein PilO
MDLRLEKFNSVIDKIAKLPSVYRMAIIALVPVLIGGLAFQTIYRPAKAEMNQLHSKQQALQRKLNEVRSVAANLDKFEEELQGLERDLLVAVRQLPSSKELPGLLTDIATLAKDAGLELSTFQPKSEIRRGFYSEVPIQLQFTGEFHKVAEFFDRVAKLPRIVNVGTIQMSVMKETLNGTVLKVSGTATTFRFLEAGGGA